MSKKSTTADTQAGGSSGMTISRWLTERLRSEIVDGELTAGARLRQTEVASRFGISTTPVRESFAALQREGLLTRVDHGGVSVFCPTVADLRDNYELRIVLEGLATELAAPRLTDRALIEMEGLLDEMRASDFDEIDRYYALNSRFHACIYAEAGRPRLERLVADFRDASGAYQRLFAIHQPSAAETQHQHQAIFAACKERDPARAGSAMREHLGTTFAVLEAALRERAVEGADG